MLISFSYTQHSGPCIPVAQCFYCRYVEYLRSHLTPEEFIELRALAESSMHITGLTEESPVAELKEYLSPRVMKCLAEERFGTIGDLLLYSKKDMLALDKFGKTLLLQLKDVLERAGFTTRWE